MNSKVDDKPNVADKSETEDTWINKIFQGTFSTFTKCLTCETVFDLKNSLNIIFQLVEISHTTSN